MRHTRSCSSCRRRVKRHKPAYTVVEQGAAHAQDLRRLSDAEVQRGQWAARGFGAALLGPHFHILRSSTKGRASTAAISCPRCSERSAQVSSAFARKPKMETALQMAIPQVVLGISVSGLLGTSFLRNRAETSTAGSANERLGSLNAMRGGAAGARTRGASGRTPPRTPAESRTAGVAGVRRTHRTTPREDSRGPARRAPAAPVVPPRAKAQKRAGARGASRLAEQLRGYLAPSRSRVGRESVVLPPPIGSVSVIPASRQFVGSWLQRS